MKNVAQLLISRGARIAYSCCCCLITGAACAQEMLIPPQYEAVLNFQEGIAPVQIDGLWGFIDRKGAVVISPQFSSVRPGSDGFFAVEGEPAGYIRAGDRKMLFDRFSSTKSFSSGVAAVQTANGLWGYIRQDGSWLFPGVFQDASEWQNDCGAVKVNDIWGLVCNDGWFWSYSSSLSEEQALHTTFPYGASSSNGMYVMETGEGQVFVRRFVSSDDWRDYFPEEDASEEQVLGADTQTTSTKDSSSLPEEYVQTGDLRIDQQFKKYKRIRPFHDGWAAASSNAKSWTFVNENGKEIGRVFQDVRDFSEGVAGVKKNGKWGFINSSGEILLEPTYDAVYTFNENVAVVRAGSKRGFLRLSDDGKISVLVEPRFDDVLRFKEGLAPVKVDGKWGFFGFESWSSVRSIQNVSAN